MSRITLAGLALIAASLIFLGTEALAAHAFSPAYRYDVNFISELGITGCGKGLHGEPMCSPLAEAMNAAFMAAGVLFAAAALLLYPRLGGRGRIAFTSLAVIHGVGLVMVGLNHATGAGVQGSTSGPPWHVIGATMAIVGGNIAIAVSPVGRAFDGPAWLRRMGPVLAAVGLVCLVLLIVEGARHGVILFGPGFWERGSVYSITAWELVMGGWLVVNARRLNP